MVRNQNLTQHINLSGLKKYSVSGYTEAQRFFSMKITAFANDVKKQAMKKCLEYYQEKMEKITSIKEL